MKGWAHQVAAQNLEVRSAALEAQIAEKKISMVQGQYVPTVSLSGSYYPKRYYENSQYDHFMYGFDVSFNNLNVGSTQAEVTRSQAEYKKAELKQHQVYSEMINAAAVSAKGLQTLRKQLSALNEAVSLEQQTLTDLDELLKDGNSTLIEVIDQRNKLFSAQEKRIQSFAHFYKLKTELYLAAGWLVPKKLNELKKQFEVVSLGKR